MERWTDNPGVKVADFGGRQNQAHLAPETVLGEIARPPDPTALKPAMPPFLHII